MKSISSRLVPAAVLLACCGAPAPARADGDLAAAASSPWAALARGRVEPPGGILPVAAGRDGIVREVRVHEGEAVAPGAVLAVLDDGEARLRLALAERQQAQARLALEPLRVRQAAAARELHRLDQLVAEQLANAQDRDEARDRAAEIAAELAQGAAAEETARAEAALAQAEVEARAIRAPVGGQIVRCLAVPGQGVGAGPAAPLFWLAPDGARVVRAELDEDSVHLVVPGQAAEVVADSAPGPVFRAKVRSVGLVFGPRRNLNDDPAERQDVRVVDCLLVFDEANPPLLLGQRVLVRFLRPAAPAR